MIKKLKQNVLEANLALVKYNLVTLTWGNASAIDRDMGLIAIKPSGVPYHKMQVEDIVVLDLDGKIVEGNLKPSSDAPTHIELYKTYNEIGGIAHTHSESATIFAQLCMEIECFGTTHADSFNGSVPATRFLNENEVANDYELNTAKVIIERFKNLSVVQTPAVLVAGHGPFTWGENADKAVEVSLILERVAKMAYAGISVNPSLKPIPEYIQKKHFNRKHGANAYYGQSR